MRVGTSVMTCDYRVDDEDHPHACGDKSITVYNRHPFLGSSPCVWGQVTFSFAYIQMAWIIPMRVGTSALSAL